MDSMNKKMLESRNLRKSFGFMEEHLSALQAFQHTHLNWQDEHKNDLDIQTAGKQLLATQGINKNILGLQSMLGQSSLGTFSATIAEHQRMLNSFLPANDRLEQVGLNVLRDSTANAIVKQNKMLRQNPLKNMVEKMALNYSLGSLLGLMTEQNNLAKSSALQSLIGNSGFLNQISKQSPFVNAVQLQMPKVEKIFGNTNVVAAMATSAPLMSSILPVANATFNFSSELDKLSFTEQQRVVDILEKINLNDDEIDMELQENLFSETRIDFSPFLESFQNFCKNNAFNICTMIGTYPTFIEDVSTRTFSNIIFDISFVICFLVLINDLLSNKNDK